MKFSNETINLTLPLFFRNKPPHSFMFITPQNFGNQNLLYNEDSVCGFIY